MVNGATGKRRRRVVASIVVGGGRVLDARWGVNLVLHGGRWRVSWPRFMREMVSGGAGERRRRIVASIMGDVVDAGWGIGAGVVLATAIVLVFIAVTVMVVVMVAVAEREFHGCFDSDGVAVRCVGVEGEP